MYKQLLPQVLSISTILTNKKKVLSTIHYKLLLQNIHGKSGRINYEINYGQESTTNILQS